MEVKSKNRIFQFQFIKKKPNIRTAICNFVLEINYKFNTKQNIKNQDKGTFCGQANIVKMA